MFSLLLRNFVFTILMPGMVAGLIPLQMVGAQLKQSLNRRFGIYQYGGMLLFLAGLLILLSCILRFAIEGRGTLAPMDPTKKLVVGGLYKRTRNPMYMGVMLILLGEALFTSSIFLLLYSCFVFILFNIFIRLYEEPRLTEVFGEQYIQYCNKVRRWI